ncbi:MAG: hypothetical protein HPY65_13210 [Syntrophaceae bacterium]|nr:hypothetical protein [Syntrophaceae bacterium]
MIPVRTMKRSHWLGMYGLLWIAVLWFLFAVPGWAPGGSGRGAAMAWFILQKGPAVLVLFVVTDFLTLHRKEETIPLSGIPEYLKKRPLPTVFFILGMALFAILNLL